MQQVSPHMSRSMDSVTASAVPLARNNILMASGQVRKTSVILHRVPMRFFQFLFSGSIFLVWHEVCDLLAEKRHVNRGTKG